jgi:hypothetical protein
VTGIRGRRRKQLPSNFKDTRRYWKLKEEMLDRTPWRIRFWRGYGSAVEQTELWEWLLWRAFVNNVFSSQYFNWAVLLTSVMWRSLLIIKALISSTKISYTKCNWIFAKLHSILILMRHFNFGFFINQHKWQNFCWQTWIWWTLVLMPSIYYRHSRSSQYRD